MVEDHHAVRGKFSLVSMKEHPLFAAVYDRLTAKAERTWLASRRARLIAQARGEVLEIGAGTGANLRHYRDVTRVVVSEPDPAMRRRLTRHLASVTVPVEVSDAPAEHLGFPDGSFDTVVSTLVLCSVADPEAALAELEPLTTDLDDYRLFHAVRAELLTALGRTAEARAANERALALAANPAERELIARRLDG